ncbi:MAG: heterodisulfide reductase-related iron-sulfur binding cluster [Desulfomonilia bacterium]
MHPLIDEHVVKAIRSTGNMNETLTNRVDILEAYNLPYDRSADNVIISGCQIPYSIPAVLQKFSRILDNGGISFTFLSQEYCCGNTLYRPAVKERNDDALNECRSLSREFISLNLQMARELGSRRIVIFCSPCYPIYKYAFPQEEIIFYPQALLEAISTMEWNHEIDYYAGCYRLHRRLAPVPMELQSTNAVFNKIHGLDINRISAPACCYTPDGLNHMIRNVKTRYMVHVCTGCYLQALLHMPEDAKTQVLMLPEFLCMLNEEEHPGENIS